MATPDNNLGVCSFCGVALIRNKALPRYISLPGHHPPANAPYPDASFQLMAVWCPNCGLIHSLDSPDQRFSWKNPDAEAARNRQATPSP